MEVIPAPLQKAADDLLSFKTREAFAAEQKRRKAAGEPLLVAIGHLPKASCPRCYGRGHVGHDTKTGNVVPCTCVGSTHHSRLRPLVK